MTSAAVVPFRVEPFRAEPFRADPYRAEQQPRARGGWSATADELRPGAERGAVPGLVPGLASGLVPSTDRAVLPHGIATVAGGPARITVAMAPPGSGATTAAALLARQAQAAGRRVAWFGPRTPPDAALAAAWDGAGLVVLDGALAELNPWRAAVRELPELRVLALVPAPPGRARSIAAGITEDDLVVRAGAWHLLLRTAQVGDLARRHGLRLTDDQSDQVCAGLGGWPSSVAALLAHLALTTDDDGRVDDSRLQVLVSHERARTLQRLPAQALAVLLDLSVAPRLHAADLAQLSPAPRAVEVAEELTAMGLCRRYQSATGVVYELPRALRLAVAAHATDADPAGTRERRRRATELLLARGEVVDAVNVAAASGDPAMTADVLDGHFSALLLDGERSAVDDLDLPGLLALDLPVPTRELVQVLLPVSTRAEVDAPGAGTPTGAREALGRTVRLARGRSLHVAVRVASAELVADREAEVGQEGARVALGALGSVLAVQAGLVRKAASLAEIAFTEARKARTWSAAAMAAQAAALALVAAGDVRTAQAWLDECARLPEPSRWWRSVVGPLDTWVQAWCANEQLDLDGVAVLRDGAPASDMTWSAPIAAHVAIMHAAAGGQSSAALDLARDALRHHGGGPDGGGSAVLRGDLARALLLAGRGADAQQAALTLAVNDSNRALVLARLALMQGEPSTARSFVTPLTGGSKAMTARGLEALLLGAEADDLAGDDTAAEQGFARAVVLARRLRCILPFRWVERDRMTRWIAGADGRTAALLEPVLVLPAPAAGDLTFVVLPERQQLVLAGLAAGLSATQLAAELYVSVNTVRTQIRSVYQRLEVHTREEAVVRATALGLLDGASSAPRRR